MHSLKAYIWCPALSFPVTESSSAGWEGFWSFRAQIIDFQLSVPACHSVNSVHFLLPSRCNSRPGCEVFYDFGLATGISKPTPPCFVLTAEINWSSEASGCWLCLWKGSGQGTAHSSWLLLCCGAAGPRLFTRIPIDARFLRRWVQWEGFLKQGVLIIINGSSFILWAFGLLLGIVPNAILCVRL